MKKHFKKLRPLLLLMALFMLTNCQEELYQIDSSENIQPNFKISAYVGKSALVQKEIALDILKKNGGNATNKLRQHLFGSDISFRTIQDVEKFIDASEVLVATAPSGVTTYTFNLLNPALEQNTYENLVIQTINNSDKIMVLTYALESEFAKNYALNGNLENFTGTVTFDLLSVDPEYPCTEAPGAGLGPGSGGGIPVYNGAGVPGVGAPDPVDPFNPDGQSSNQLLIDAKFLAMKFRNITVEIVSGPIESGPGAPSTPVTPPTQYRTAIFSSFGLQNPSNPCAEDDIIPITLGGGEDDEDNNDDDCFTLKALINTPAIKNSLNSLKESLNENNENLFTFHKSGNGDTYAAPQIANSGNSAVMRKNNSIYGVAHTHQNGTSNTPSEIFKMFSFADIQSIHELGNGFMGSGQSAAPLFFNMMVINNYTYIIFPNDFDTFKNHEAFQSKKKATTLDWKLEEKYKIQKAINNDSHNALARELLKFINDSNNLNLNMSLYRISNESNFTGAWEKIELDPNNFNNLKQPIPCK